jgi:predicted nuclease of predicted toxin-antitoxin system
MSLQVKKAGLQNHKDKFIWEYSKENYFTIVTFDSDFYDFSLVWGHPPKIIWIRTFNQTTDNIKNIIRKYEQAIKAFGHDENLACLEIFDVKEQQ